jgi:zinc-binding alcohol dehydrogenase/oxidoreductase
VISPSLKWGNAPEAPGPAYEILGSRGRLIAGETVVVAAASSGVGSVAIQIAQGLGARVIAVSSSPEKAKTAEEFGAHDVVLRTESESIDRLVVVTGGRVDLALDQTGALWHPLLQSLRPGGRLVVVGQMAAAIGTARVQTVCWKQVDVMGSSMGSPDDFAELLAHVETADWRPVVDSEYPLHDIDAAYARLDARDRIGRVVLELSQDAESSGVGDRAKDAEEHPSTQVHRQRRPDRWNPPLDLRAASAGLRLSGRFDAP